MRILSLGGTIFLGRHTVDAALARGHEVTLFNRGTHNPTLFPQVEKLHGDRDGDLAALRGRTWDAVIDTSGYLPRAVRQSAELLSDAANHYTFISSISVYPHPVVRNADESTPVEVLDDPTSENIGEHYGGLKALCEQVVDEYFPNRALNVRAGMIVGPYDYTDRFPYWVDRVARGGEVLAPGRPDRPVQLIDARDIAEWNIRMIESGTSGTFNVTGPHYPLTMQAMLEACRRATNSDARFTWLDEAFLNAKEVGMWTEMPFWISEDMNGLLEINVQKALDTGLTFRPLEATVRDVHEWNQTRAADETRWGVALGDNPPKTGMTPEREAALLQQWHVTQKI
jgi:2'-hydroxyisoflavone reductase